MHEPEDALKEEPGGQGLQLAAPKAATVPGAHRVHKEAPTVEEYVSMGQGRHSHPGRGENVPTGQGSQDEELTLDVAPTGHALHTVAPAVAATLPCGQAVQREKYGYADDTFVAFVALPRTTERLMRLVEFALVEFPEEFVAVYTAGKKYPETTLSRYSPAEQGWHAGASGAVAFVALPEMTHSVQLALLVAPNDEVKEPRGHALQVAGVVAPTAALHVPGGHAVQLEASADALVGAAAHSPAAHNEHTDAPASEDVFAGHRGHTVVAFTE